MLAGGEVEMLDGSLTLITQDATEVAQDAASALENTRRISAASVVLELGKKLLHAAREGDTAAVLSLMSRGAPFTTDWLGTSPLHLAAMNANEETCRALLRAGISRDTRTKVERTPLHLAAYEGHAHIVRLLLEQGARHDARDMLHMTPLHWAVERRHVECARALLAAGADVFALSRFRKTPLSLAAESGDSQIIDLLTSAPPPPPPAKDPTPPPPPEPSPPPPTPSPPHASPAPHLSPTEPQTQHDTRDAAALLRRHGITMLPADTNDTLISALRSGRTVVLSDAGKLMLRESAGAAAPAVTVVHTATLSSPVPVMQIATPRVATPTTKPKIARIVSINGNQILQRVTPLPAGATVLPFRTKGPSPVIAQLPANTFIPKVATTAALSAAAATQHTNTVAPTSSSSEVSRLRAELATVRTALREREREVRELKRRLLAAEHD